MNAVIRNMQAERARALSAYRPKIRRRVLEQPVGSVAAVQRYDAFESEVCAAFAGCGQPPVILSRPVISQSGEYSFNISPSSYAVGLVQPAVFSVLSALFVRYNIQVGLYSVDDVPCFRCVIV